MLLYNTKTKRTMEGTPALLKLLVNKGWIDAAELDKEETKFPFVVDPDPQLTASELGDGEGYDKPGKFIEEESIIHPQPITEEDLSTDQEKKAKPNKVKQSTTEAEAVKPKQNKNKK